MKKIAALLLNVVCVFSLMSCGENSENNKNTDWTIVKQATCTSDGIKEKYIEGTKIELIKMYDIQAPLPKTRGFIESVDDKGTLHIRWENGSSLGLVVGVDEFKVICPLCNQELRGF